MSDKNTLPIAIIGAGPVGLAAAAHLSLRNQPFMIFEMGQEVADSVRSWEHVPMFSPWRYNIDKSARKILSHYDWKRPLDDHLPTGRQLIEDYLEPLSMTNEINPYIHLNSKVRAITRKRINKMRNAGRQSAPFVLQVEQEGLIKLFEARAVIDASGTWKHPNPAGANGLPAIGEVEHHDKIYYGVPDVLGKHKSRYLNKDIAVIGGGHSAINVLLELADLGIGKLDWILTKSHIQDAYGGLGDDELPGRGLVGQRVKELVDSERIAVHTPFFTEHIRSADEKLVVIGQSTQGVEEVQVDELIVSTGLRPDLSFLKELRLSLDPSIESPIRLAPLIDPNNHSCGSVAPHGEAELRHPDKNFYIVGMKSYGRAPTFLLATGYEQVRSIVAGLAGDWEAARKVHLELPESGVCGVPPAVDPNNLIVETASSSCCE